MTTPPRRQAETPHGCRVALGHCLSEACCPPASIGAGLGQSDGAPFPQHGFLMVGRQTADSAHGEAPRPGRRSAARTNKYFEPTLEVRCLGYFSIRPRADARPIKLKTNTRPAALLQLLIAVGPKGIEKRQVEEMLWPPAQEKIARGRLNTASHRLRRILGVDHACRVEQSIIKLDASALSIDAWVFDSEAESLHARLRQAADLDSGEIAIRCERLLELYRGPFLATQPAPLWIVITRDRLQAKFVKVIKAAGAFWQANGRWDRAARLYERVIESDNFAEDAYRELMRCHLAQRQFSEAIRVFDRCRDWLALAVGIAPSDETEALHRQALATQKDDTADGP